jgi:outer membrane scaffolding protein for murein synthesis (MipA/OmpV family)
MKRIVQYLTLGLLLVMPLPGMAEQKPLWELGFGFGGLTAPDYRGSDEQRAYLLPVPYIVYRGKVLRVDRSGIYGKLIHAERVRLDLSFDAGVPVNSSDNRARIDMPDLDPTIEVGPSLEVCLWSSCTADRVLQFRAPLRAVFSTNFSHFNSAGWVFNPHLNMDIKNIGPGGGWNFGFAIGPLYGSEKNHDYYFQVDPLYATASRPAFDAHAGYGGSRVTLALSKRYNGVWIGTFARYDDLSGARFEESPLVRVERSFMAGFGVSWFFAHSDTLVDVEP